MGARIESSDGHAPLIVEPRPLTPLVRRLNVASAQVKSAILLAGLNAPGETRVVEPGVSRDHTERLLPAFGAAVDSGRLHGSLARSGAPEGSPHHRAGRSVVGGVHDCRGRPGAEFVHHDRSGGGQPDPRRLSAHRRTHGGRRSDGRPIEDASAGAEPVANLQVSTPARLVGTRIPAEWVPLAIDEFPLVMAMAAAGQGETVISGAGELRVKESDRLAVMSRQLRRLGVDVEEQPDGAVVRGGRVLGGRVESGGDHRIAMSLAVLALVAEGPVEIDGAEWIRTSYPDFARHLETLGVRLQWR